MKKKKLKKTKKLCERVFDYVFRDFEDLRLSCVHNENDEPLNEYVVFKAVPGFINAFRGLKVWEKTRRGYARGWLKWQAISASKDGSTAM